MVHFLAAVPPAKEKDAKGTLLHSYSLFSKSLKQENCFRIYSCLDFLFTNI